MNEMNEMAILNTIASNPNDLLSWMALADILEEKEENERAELVRLTYSLRTLHRPEKEKRVQELLISGVKPCTPIVTNSLGMKLVPIPSGTFLMGTKDRIRYEYGHNVHISNAPKTLFMSIFQTTQLQFSSVGFKNQSFVKGGSIPVTNVSWYDAVKFCEALTEKERGSGLSYRLPTEAEWEYACRAGTTTDYNIGDGEESLSLAGWYYANRGLVFHQDSANEVGRKIPNAWGLYDMHGNVCEWCSDWYGQDYCIDNPSIDPEGPLSGSYRVNRGGSWHDLAKNCRSANRFGTPPFERNGFVGFRVVATMDFDR